MKEHNIECLTYALQENGEYIIQNLNDDDEFFYIKSNDYISNLAHNTNFLYSKLPSDRDNHEIHIDDINRQISEIEQFIKTIENTNMVTKLSNLISQFHNESINFEACYNYLKKIINNNNYIENINNIDYQYNQLKKWYNNLENNLSDLVSKDDFQQTNENLDILFQYTKSLTDNFRYIINLINNITIAHFNFFSFIRKSIFLMDSFIQNQKTNDSSLKKLTIKAVLIDQTRTPILVLENSNDEEKESTESRCQSIVMDFILKYSEQVKIDTKNEKRRGIKQKLSANLMNLKTKLTNLIKTEFCENYTKSSLFHELNSISKTEFKNVKESQNQFIELHQERCTLEFYFQNLQSITKFNFLLNSKSFLKNFDSIFNLYFEYVGSWPMTNTNDNFVSFFMKYKNESQTAKPSMKDLIETISKEVNQSNIYFAFDVLFQLILKNLLEKTIFSSQNYAISQIENEEDEDIDSKYKLICNNDIVNDSATSKLLYNKELSLFLEIDYNAEPDENLLKLREREIAIFSGDYSKFVVHMIDKIRDNRIVIPYYSSRTLNKIIHTQYKFNKEIKKTIKLTFVDKIVIFLEIAIAFRDLHAKDVYHGNLSTHFVFISSSNDAYLFGFSYDRNQESNLSKMGTNFYYHPPELIKLNKSSDADDQNNNEDPEQKQEQQQEQQEQQQEQQQNDGNEKQATVDEKFVDIYSFGLFLHEVITETNVQTRMGNKARSERLKILNENFFGFIMGGRNNEYFDENNYAVDQKGDCFIGMKEIIQKCLQIKIEDRYSSFDEIIDAIKSLPIYLRNKEEIEYRILNAPDSRQYECTLANLTESYLRGQEDSLTDLVEVLEKYRQIYSKEQFEIMQNDIIKSIFKVFNLKNTEDLTYIFEDIFNYIIYDYHMKKIGQNAVNDLTDNLFKFSSYVNSNCKIPENDFIQENIVSNEFIIPITTLNDFAGNNANVGNTYSLNWIYLIAKEISIMHSFGLPHGNISPYTIGIYYCNEVQAFVPSIILYYYIYKKYNNNNSSSSGCKKLKKKNSQRKDTRSFIKLMNFFKIELSDISEGLSYDSSIDEICFELHNFIIKNINNGNNNIQQNIFAKISSNNDYSSYQVTYPIMHDIFNLMKNGYLLNNSFLEIDMSLQIIHEFLKNTNSNPNNTINENIPQKIERDDDDVLNLFVSINEKCALICSSFFSDIFPSAVEIQEITDDDDGNGGYLEISLNKSKSEVKNKLKYDRPSFKLIHRDRSMKRKKWFDNAVERKVEMIELYSNSVEFLLRRYIYNLNPSLNYRLYVKISNKEYSKYQDKPLKFEDVESMAKKLGFNEIANINGCVVITIRKS